jgi:hypothetical protein
MDATDVHGVGKTNVESSPGIGGRLAAVRSLRIMPARTTYENERSLMRGTPE